VAEALGEKRQAGSMSNSTRQQFGVTESALAELTRISGNSDNAIHPRVL
jgi:hypothetical protein